MASSLSSFFFVLPSNLLIRLVFLLILHAEGVPIARKAKRESVLTLIPLALVPLMGTDKKIEEKKRE